MNTPELKALGKDIAYNFDGAQAALLERFPSPLSQGAGQVGRIKIKCPEFTSLCPLTGQPDFATIIIKYRPGAWCVESKSLKLYLVSFRQHGAFHEAVIQQIADDLIKLLDPKYLEVRGKFTPRGGIPFWPSVSYYNVHR